MQSKRRELTNPEQAAAKKLRQLWDDLQAEVKAETGKKMPQSEASYQLGFASPSAFNQYLNGYIPINLKQLLNFAAFFGVTPAEIDPVLARKIKQSHYNQIENPTAGERLGEDAAEYECYPDVELLVRAIEYFADVITLEEGMHRGAAWSARTIKNLHDLFRDDPATMNLAPETIIKFINQKEVGS